MKFFEGFRKQKEFVKSDDSTRSQQELLEAMTSYSSTLTEVKGNEIREREEMSAQTLEVRRDHTEAVTRASHIESLKEVARLQALNQLLTMKIEHGGLAPDDSLPLQKEIEHNTAKIKEREEMVAKAIAEARKAVI